MLGPFRRSILGRAPIPQHLPRVVLHTTRSGTSCSRSTPILLGDALSLDGHYTVFGHVERGSDVLDAIAAVATDEKFRPRVPLEIVHAEVVESPDALAGWRSAGRSFPQRGPDAPTWALV